MKKFILTLLVSLSFISSAFAADSAVTASGFTFTPSSIAVNVGERVIFNVNFSFHPTVQVDQLTWILMEPLLTEVFLIQPALQPR
ncbi:MAG: hypothetical protein K2X48_07670 [Chitinophagaceae bacterium]|nr:hypothetical protein [Chitinophagaceae bacterium]